MSFFNPFFIYWDSGNPFDPTNVNRKPYVSGKPINKISERGRRRLDIMKSEAVDVEFIEIRNHE